MDCYILLGLARGASPAEIKRAYRRLARRYHPDINPGDRESEAFFRQIVSAYETLIDPGRRREYDAGMIRSTDRATEPAFEFQGFDFSQNLGFRDAATVNELFAEVFTPPAGAWTRPEDGADLHANLTISFGDAMAGGERRVTVTRLERCTACRGGGQLKAPDAMCPHCTGTGSVRWTRHHMVFTKNCAPCAGTGRQQSRACPACAGEGVSVRSEAVPVQIPAGVADGARLRIPGKGHVGRRAGRPGDLHVAITVEPHPLFHREGDDLRVVVPVAIHEAALGAKIDVPTIDGPARLRMPPGTQSGQRLRLRDRGAPSPRDGTRGDLIVEVKLVLPRVIDERSKELLREFGRINAENVRKNLGV
ncbi:MAG: J domain-containing protein [Acidobacteria bacterium]|nr:J domain-containing protein [Acidobacteriota bacterium]